MLMDTQVSYFEARPLYRRWELASYPFLFGSLEPCLLGRVYMDRISSLHSWSVQRSHHYHPLEMLLGRALRFECPGPDILSLG